MSTEYDVMRVSANHTTVCTKERIYKAAR